MSNLAISHRSRQSYRTGNFVPQVFSFNFANPLAGEVVRHLPSAETTKDQFLAIALMEGTWVGWGEWVCE